MNKELEPIMRAEWELANPMKRLSLRYLPRPKPKWQWKKETGKLFRGSKGGINWHRYQKEILIPKMFPFAKECALTRPGTVVQEDKAPSHNHWFQQRFFDLHDVQRLLWCPNSPDLNAIKAAWPWMKKTTTGKMWGQIPPRQ